MTLISTNRPGSGPLGADVLERLKKTEAPKADVTLGKSEPSDAEWIKSAMAKINSDGFDRFPQGPVLFSGQTPVGNLPSTTGGALVRNDKQQRPDSQVRALQRDLNDWLSAEKKPVLNANGLFGADTETALRAFQTANGITPADGVVNQETLTRLKLVAHPALGALPADVRARAIDVLKDPRTSERAYEVLANREMVGRSADLFKLLGDENFEKLEPAVQQQMLEQVLNHASDHGAIDVFSDLQMMMRPLTGLKPEQQSLVLGAMSQLSGDSDARGAVAVTTSNLPLLSPASRDEFIRQLSNGAGNVERLKNVSELAMSKLPRLSPGVQKAALELLARNAGVERFADRITFAFNQPDFDKRTEAQQLEILKHLER